MATTARITLDKALEHTRTGDIWLFRGHTLADRAIRVSTNSPVNHVGMSVVIEDLPPLMWHAELGRSLEDLWSGNRHRGVQLHDLRAAVLVWTRRYGQHAWLRQLEIRRCRDGGRAAAHHRPAGRHPVPQHRPPGQPVAARPPAHPHRPGRGPACAAGPLVASANGPADGPEGPGRALETAYCAEVVAATYQSMGLLSGERQPQWYDPGRFWSGDELELLAGARLGGEIAVQAGQRGPGREPPLRLGAGGCAGR